MTALFDWLFCVTGRLLAQWVQWAPRVQRLLSSLQGTPACFILTFSEREKPFAFFYSTLPDKPPLLALYQLVSGSYHNEGAVEVETLSTALGHHVPAPALAVLQHGPDEQQQAEAGVAAQEQQLPAVVVPVGSGEVARSMALLLIQIRRLQPVRSTEEEGRGTL